jgi:hypothetical protein
MHWLEFIFGGSIVIWVALAILAPSVLTVLASWLVALSPLLKGFADFVVSYLSIVWKGGLKILDDGAPAIVFVITAMVLAGLFWPFHFHTYRPYYIAPVSDNCTSTPATPRRFFTPKRAPVRSTKPEQMPADDDGFMPWWSRPN